MLQRSLVTVIVLALLGGSCGSRESTAALSASAPAASPPSTAAARPRIVVLGDSLTAGLGLTPEESYVALLQQRLDAEGVNFEVVNAGVSGDTSAGGLRRLDWALDGNVKVLIVALGGNDGLRGLPVAEMKRNIGQIIERAGARGVSVLLAGMEAPPNYGPFYVAQFHQAFRSLAAQYRVPLLPFLLQDVAGVATLNQPDGIHPNAEGARIVSDHVWAALRPMLSPS
jgi:acyl-CoA thioesterase-1